ncbi:MAG: hypothetical protein ACKOB6_00195 [Candidatus Kapaibacterium sp.]
MPKKVPIAELEEGCILAEPVINKFGQVLFGAGVTIEARHVRILKTWNVAEVLVREADSESLPAVITQSLRGLAEDRLAQRLKWKPRNVNEQDFLSMGIDHIAEQIAQNTRRP